MNSSNAAIISMLERLRVELASDFAALGLVDLSHRRLVWNYMAGSMNERSLVVKQMSNVGLSGAAIRSGRPSLSKSAMSASERFKLGEPLMLTEQLRIAVSVPLRMADQMIGVVLLGRRSSANYGNEEQNLALERAGELAALIHHTSEVTK